VAEQQFELTEEDKQKLDSFLDYMKSTFFKEKGNLIPVLQEAQSRIGYLPREAMESISDYLGVSRMEVYSVVTFYNQFRVIPPGKHSIRVCLGTACHVKGGEVILDAWKRRLEIDSGQTTPDREYDLETVACVGACALAPITLVDGEVQGKISPTRVDGILLEHQMERDKQQRSGGNQ